MQQMQSAEPPANVLSKDPFRVFIRATPLPGVSKSPLPKGGFLLRLRFWLLWTTTLVLAIPLYAVLGVISSTARALGEEIGWRGFLLPRLVEQTGFTWGCLFSGCIWAVWHYPGLLFADYNSGTQPVFALTCFTLMVIADACLMGWLRLKSGSLWPAAILHASHNLFIQAIFDGMTAPVGRVLYVTTEFGFGLVLTIGGLGLYFWTRRDEVGGIAVQATDAMAFQHN